MPFYELGFWVELTAAGQSEWCIMAIPEPPRRIAFAMDFGRNEYFEFPGDRRQAECTPVKRFMMDAA